MATPGNFVIPSLEILDPSQPHSFTQPSKKINEGEDVSTFLTSLAYRDIVTFILQLNRSMTPSKTKDHSGNTKIHTWPLNSQAVEFSESIRRLQLLLSKLDSIIDEVPPDTGPRRFGNISFRKWYQVLEERVSDLLDDTIAPEILSRGSQGPEFATAKTELTAYFLGSFGSAQRLDYGTGHELSFLAFLGCLWKLNGFPKADFGVEERGIVLGVIEPYLELIRRLIKTYTLEPAGSHGVWGLDDHSFIPYMFGSAQFAPPITPTDMTPVEGSLPSAPDPSDVTKAGRVESERKNNMYFSAIGFIYDVKRGPFWEHSPMLYDISGIKDGWAKINKGMIKMYNAEVLSKFPVVQHFPFGSLFRWEHDPTAIAPPPSVHMASRPEKPTDMRPPPTSTSRPAPGPGTRAPWATPSASARPSGPGVGTTAPWATAGPGAADPGSTRAPWAQGAASQPPPSGPPLTTQAPWASSRQSDLPSSGLPSTKAPWAKPGS